MCWNKLIHRIIIFRVSVAGCLGYDVLDISHDLLSDAITFQLLVV